MVRGTRIAWTARIIISRRLTQFAQIICVRTVVGGTSASLTAGTVTITLGTSYAACLGFCAVTIWCYCTVCGGNEVELYFCKQIAMRSGHLERWVDRSP